MDRHGDAGWALTDEGRAILDRVDATRSALLADVPAEELERLSTALDAVSTALGLDGGDSDGENRRGFGPASGAGRGFGPFGRGFGPGTRGFGPRFGPDAHPFGPRGHGGERGFAHGGRSYEHGGHGFAHDSAHGERTFAHGEEGYGEADHGRPVPTTALSTTAPATAAVAIRAVATPDTGAVTTAVTVTTTADRRSAPTSARFDAGFSRGREASASGDAPASA